MGSLERTAAMGRVDSRLALELPDGFNIDPSYHQPVDQSPGHGVNTIPPGIDVVAHGQGNNWAIANPALVNGRTFEISMSCDGDTGLQASGCSVHVDVCAKGTMSDASSQAQADAPKLPQLRTGYQGVALLIGNSNYQVKEMQLTDPAQDVKGMADALTQLGWQVIPKKDCAIEVC